MAVSRKKIKLVIGTNDFVLGGVQRLIVDTLRRLDRERFQIYLITLLQFPGKADFYDLVPEDVKLIKHDFKGIKDIRQWYALYKTLRDIRPDVVDSALFFSNTVFTVLKLFCGYQIITGEHNTGAQKPLAMRFVSRALAPLKYKIVADSNMVAQFVSRTEHIPLSRFRVIYNGVDLAEVEQAKKEYGTRRDDIRRELGIAPDDFVFLNLSRVVAQKMHELAIAGFKRFTEGKEGYRLVIVGGGSHMSLIRELLEKLGLQGTVLLMGERRDVKRFYCIADAFLLTSRHEGFCIAAMEGLAFGLPLVSTKVAGVVEYLRDGENGYFITDLTPEAVAEGLEKLMRSDRKAMGEKAALSAQPYSSERSAASYQQLFLESVGL